MIHNNIITENRLDDWVRGNAREAQGVIVELVWRLVAASAPNSKRRFPLGDSIGQPGPDGILETDFGFRSFLPEGKSFWEIGTGSKPWEKATDDYTGLTVEPATAIAEEIRQQSIFIFVTPLSGVRGWKQPAQVKWLKERHECKEWRDIRIIDGTVLIDWLHHFPAIERWLADAMRLPVQQIETPEQRWATLRTIGDPPPLTPHVFLANRDEAREKIKEVFSGTLLRVRLDTRYPRQAADFVVAYLASLDEETKIEAVGRCLILSGAEAWEAVTTLRERHVLIADFDLDDTESSSSQRLLEKAKRAGHAIVFGGMHGGHPDPNRVDLRNAKDYQIKEALEKAGYNEERARNLAQKSDGNLNSLLRCIQNLSLMPEWAQGGDVSELAIAALLGGWNERSEADKAIVEQVSGNVYGEWIGKMRETALRPGAPLIQRDGFWKVVARYEAWYALGSRLFDEHLDKLKETAVAVLHERDPQFDLPPDERYMANIHGKTLSHSQRLRNGLAESLALLGSHPKAMTSCSFGKAETTAMLAVREILASADSVLWASLNSLLPLLAEAAPREFLDAVENAVYSDPCPFDWVFKQEGKGFLGGANYMTGLLWALETLAWDADYLTRVVMLLGELASRDPGGNWGNRPANSLTTMLLPWLPQTCAPVAKRKIAVATLLNELPDVAWKLLLALLPNTHQFSSGSRKPAWREMISDDWSKGVTHQEYWEQTAAYAELAVGEAKQDIAKLANLIDRLDNFPPSAYQQILAHLRSDAVISMSEAERLRVWNELTRLISKHRKFADTDWAMKSEVVDEIEAITEGLAPKSPIYLHERLFTEHDFELFEEKGNWEEQRKKLDDQRKEAIKEIYLSGGMQAVFTFAQSVRSAWQAGIAFGAIIEFDSDANILPLMLESAAKSLAQFVAGFVCGRFCIQGWPWIDGMHMSNWTPSEKAQLFAHLPFNEETWGRLAKNFGKNEAPYWAKTYVNPYQAEKNLELAIDRLVEHGRPHEAIRCLERLRHDKEPLNSQQIVRVLQAMLHSSETAQAIDQNAVVEIIKVLQDDPNTNPADLFQIEWAFLPLLNEHRGASPKLLGQQLADDPDFFCEAIRLIFRSDKEDRPVEEPTEQQKNMATNAYHLLYEWKMLPGSQKDGAFDGNALTAWLERVKASCSESGHLDIALSTFGEALVHTPADPDGLWIHHAAARALNAKDAQPMRDGFRTALFNSRGVHSWTAGRAERELAESYRTKAEEVEAYGYHRLARTLRELSDSYKRDAERQASRDPFDD